MNWRDFAFVASAALAAAVAYGWGYGDGFLDWSASIQCPARVVVL